MKKSFTNLLSTIKQNRIIDCIFALFFSYNIMKYFSFILLISILLSALSAATQEYTPVQGSDYDYFTETDEVGAGWKVLSCYLKNTCDKKILFFNFRGAQTAGTEVLKDLLKDILILDPHRSLKICKYKLSGEMLGITWNAEMLDPSVGFNKFPESGKNYIFFWTSSETSEQVSYSYFLKNISDRWIKFYAFKLAPASGLKIKNEPPLSQYLWQDSIAKVVEFTVPTTIEAPMLNWTAEFTDLQPTGDPFCDALIQILEASGQGDFADVKGDPNGSGDYLCTIPLPGTSQAAIRRTGDKWQYFSQIGETGLKKGIEARFKVFTEKTDNCIPDVIALTIVKNKATKNKSALFTGSINETTYTLVVSVEGLSDQPSGYRLILQILGTQ